MDHLTHESIDSRLLDILKETDDLFQSGHLTQSLGSAGLDVPLLSSAEHHTRDLFNTVPNNVRTKHVAFGDSKVHSIEPIKSLNGNGHFFSNPALANTDVYYNNDHSLLSYNQQYSTNSKTKLYEAKQFDQEENIKQWDPFKNLEQIKPSNSTNLYNSSLTQAQVLPKDFSIVSNWNESQKEVFYNFANKLKQEYHRLQHQLYMQSKLDLDKNIKLLRFQYLNSNTCLQQELTNLRALQQNFATREAEYGEKIFKYESELGAAKQEIENLYNELQMKRDHIISLTRQLSDYENAIAELKHGKLSLEEQVIERDKQLETIENELSDSLNKSEFEHRKNGTLNQNLLQANAVISATNNELAISKREIEKLTSENERLNGTIKILRETEFNLNQRIADTSTANTNLISKLDNLNLEKSALYSRIEEITSSYEKQISLYNRRINQLEIELESKADNYNR